MSLQTTLARADARSADEVWQRHRKTCPTCGPAARARKYGELCPDGKVALSVREDLRKKAESEAEADKRPISGQEPLFTDEDLRTWLAAADAPRVAESLVANLDLIIHALADAQNWRETNGDEDAAELYAALAAELEEFQ